MYNQGGSFKERLEAIASSWKEKSAPMEKRVEKIEEIAEKPEEIEGYVERVEKEVEVVAPMSTPAPQNPKVKLPLDDTKIQMGLHRRVWEGIRWLAEWCLRRLKMVS